MGSQDPLDRIDELMLEIAGVQAEILTLVAASMADHQAVDAKYAPQLNPLYREAWNKFLELQRIAEAHKPELMARGKKSSRRSTGVIGWRTNSQLVLHTDTEELIKRIRAMGTAVSRKLLRRRVIYELRPVNIKADENAGLVAGIDGLEVTSGDVCYIDPNNGLHMSTANVWWPQLDGVTSTRAFKTLFKDPDA